MLVLWVLGWALALGGSLLYMLTQEDWSWWLAGLFFGPLIWLTLERMPWSSGGGGGGAGPWGPP